MWNLLIDKVKLSAQATALFSAFAFMSGVVISDSKATKQAQACLEKRASDSRLPFQFQGFLNDTSKFILSFKALGAMAGASMENKSEAPLQMISTVLEPETLAKKSN